MALQVKADAELMATVAVAVAKVLAPAADAAEIPVHSWNAS